MYMVYIAECEVITFLIDAAAGLLSYSAIGRDLFPQFSWNDLIRNCYCYIPSTPAKIFLCELNHFLMI